jgi:hypothetical protein
VTVPPSASQELLVRVCVRVCLCLSMCVSLVVWQRIDRTGESTWRKNRVRQSPHTQMTWIDRRRRPLRNPHKRHYSPAFIPTTSQQTHNHLPPPKQQTNGHTHTTHTQDKARPGFLQCYDPSTSQRLGEVKIMTAQDVSQPHTYIYVCI